MVEPSREGHSPLARLGVAKFVVNEEQPELPSRALAMTLVFHDGQSRPESSLSHLGYALGRSCQHEMTSQPTSQALFAAEPSPITIATVSDRWSNILTEPLRVMGTRTHRRCDTSMNRGAEAITAHAYCVTFLERACLLENKVLRMAQPSWIIFLFAGRISSVGMINAHQSVAEP